MRSLPIWFARASIRIVAILTCFVLSLYLLDTYLIGSNAVDDAALQNTLTPAPNVHCVLVPHIVNYIDLQTPGDFRQAATNGLIDLRDSELGQRICGVNEHLRDNSRLSPQRIYATAIELAVELIFIWLFTAMLFALARAAFPDSTAYALAATLLALLLIPAFEMRFARSSDFPELFFSCACLYFMLKRKWIFYLPAVALATLNSEATVFSLFFYFVWFYPRLPRGRYFLLGVMQATMLAILLILLHAHIHAGVYQTISFNGIRENLIGHLLNAMGYNYAAVLAIVLTAILLISRWHEKPALLRGALVMFLPNALAYLLLSAPGEWRAFYWCLPAPILLVAHTLVRSAGIQHSTIFRTARVATQPYLPA